MTIQDEGFLSAEVGKFIERYHGIHGPVFALARDLNMLGQQAVKRESVVGSGLSDVEPLIFLLLVRMLSNFQGAILMAERGALVESRTLSRTCLETVFCLAALARGGEDYVQRMSRAILDERKKAANWILSKPAICQLMGKEHIDKLHSYMNQVANRLDKIKGLGIEEMARQGNLEALYTWYRQLSGDAAHPTLDALERYLVTDSAGKTAIRWGPDCDSDELGWTILLSCNWLFAGLYAADEKLGLQLSKTSFADLWSRFQALSRPIGEPSLETGTSHPSRAHCTL